MQARRRRLLACSLESGETRLYDSLFVCNGHHWNPRWPEPEFSGSFHGRILHSHDYKDAADFKDKRIVVLGIGNSAMDISVECTYVAKEVYLATRRGAHISPKYVWGRPLDHWTNPWMPYWFTRWLARFMIWVQVGSYESFGLPTPDHKLLEAHPSVSTAVYDRLAHGDIKVKPNISHYQGDRVYFVDGSFVEADVVIYCTGYKVSFPFFDPDFISAPDNDLPLYLRMIKPGINNLFSSDCASRWERSFPSLNGKQYSRPLICSGHCALPAVDEMIEDMNKEREAMFKRYVRSKRHTMQVDFDPFMRKLANVIKAGEKQARLEGNPLPVPGHVGQGIVTA